MKSKKMTKAVVGQVEEALRLKEQIESLQSKLRESVYQLKKSLGKYRVGRGQGWTLSQFKVELGVELRVVNPHDRVGILGTVPEWRLKKA